MIGVVIVTYNSGDVIEECLNHCKGMHVIVVDNASTDNTVQTVRRRTEVALIANETNRGFAGGVNQGVQALDSPLILILNPDVQILTPLDALIEACSQPGVAAASGRLVDASGQTQRGFTFRRFPTPAVLMLEVLGINRLWPGNPANRRYRCLDQDLSLSTEIEQPAGAFILLRREVWELLGGFDINFYPVWFEDVDFCQRIADRGLKIRYVPDVAAFHRGGASISRLEWGCREVYWYASLLRYASKRFRSMEIRGVSLAIMLASLPRAVVGSVRRRNGEPLSAYARVVRLATMCAVRGRFPERLFESSVKEGSRLRKINAKTRS